jgi:hypothetical protein
MKLINPESDNALIEVNYWLIPLEDNMKPSIRKRIFRLSDISSIADQGEFIKDKDTEIERGVTIYINDGFDAIIAAEKYAELIKAWTDYLNRKVE